MKKNFARFTEFWAQLDSVFHHLRRPRDLENFTDEEFPAFYQVFKLQVDLEKITEEHLLPNNQVFGPRSTLSLAPSPASTNFGIHIALYFEHH